MIIAELLANVGGCRDGDGACRTDSPGDKGADCGHRDSCEITRTRSWGAILPDSSTGQLAATDSAAPGNDESGYWSRLLPAGPLIKAIMFLAKTLGRHLEGTAKTIWDMGRWV